MNPSPAPPQFKTLSIIIPCYNEKETIEHVIESVMAVPINLARELIIVDDCSKDGTRFGWFASYANTQVGHIVTVVFLQGGRPTFGPKAAEISGKFYRGLYDHKFFTTPATATSRANSEKSTGVGAQQ